MTISILTNTLTRTCTRYIQSGSIFFSFLLSLWSRSLIYLIDYLYCCFGASILLSPSLNFCRNFELSFSFHQFILSFFLPNFFLWWTEFQAKLQQQQKTFHTQQQWPHLPPKSWMKNRWWVSELNAKQQSKTSTTSTTTTDLTNTTIASINADMLNENANSSW